MRSLTIMYYVLYALFLLIIVTLSGMIGIGLVDLKLFMYGGEFYGIPEYDFKEYIMTLAFESAAISLLIYVLFSDYLVPIMRKAFKLNNGGDSNVQT